MLDSGRCWLQLPLRGTQEKLGVGILVPGVLQMQVLAAGLPACERFALGYSLAEDGKS